MTETKRLPDLEVEIEAERTAEGYDGMNNFRAIMLGGYRHKVLQDNPDFGNQQEPDSRKGQSLRGFTEYANKLMGQLGIDQDIVEKLQKEVIQSSTEENLQKLNDYIFPVYRELRLEGFSHADCTA